MLNILEPCIHTAQLFPVAGLSLGFIPHTINPFRIIKHTPRKVLKDEALQKNLRSLTVSPYGKQILVFSCNATPKVAINNEETVHKADRLCLYPPVTVSSSVAYKTTELNNPDCYQLQNNAFLEMLNVNFLHLLGTSCLCQVQCPC